MADSEAVHWLLVEGPTDEKFFSEFLRHLGIASTIHIYQYGGRNNLSRYLPALPANTDFGRVTRIGIVRDADYNTDAFISIQTAIQNANRQIKTPALQLPEIESPGTFYGDRRKIAAWILPEPGIPGMLENVILNAFQDDPTLDCITDFFDCVRSVGVNIVQENEAKTRLKILTYTKNLNADESSSRDRDKGDMYRMSWWSWDKPAFKNIENFLRGLATD